MPPLIVAEPQKKSAAETAHSIFDFRIFSHLFMDALWPDLIYRLVLLDLSFQYMYKWLCKKELGSDTPKWILPVGAMKKYPVGNSVKKLPFIQLFGYYFLLSDCY